MEETVTATAPSPADQYLLDHRLHCDCGRDITSKATNYVATLAGACGSGKSKARTKTQARKASLAWWRSPEGIAKRKAARVAKKEKRKAAKKAA